MSSAMMADGPLGDRAKRFGAAASRLEAVKGLFVAEAGAERFPPATRFAIVVGGSTLFWAGVAAMIVAVRH